jgi:hypothetical protein
MEKEIQQYISATLFDTLFEKSSNSYCTFYTYSSFAPTHNTVNALVPFHWDDLKKITDEHLSITTSIKNSIVILIPDSDMAGSLNHHARQAIAAEKVKKEVKDDNVLFDEAKVLARNNEAQVQQIFRGMYSKLRYLYGSDIKETDLKPMRGNTIRDALLTRLRELGKLVDLENIKPDMYLQKLLGQRDRVQVRELFENIEDMSALPFAYRADTREIIKKGVYEGAIGLVRGTIPDTLTADFQVFHRSEVLGDIKDGDTVLAAADAKNLIATLSALDQSSGDQSIISQEHGASERTGATQVTLEGQIPEEEDKFVADASGIAQELGKRMTKILVSGLQVRAILTFTGSITGTVTASNLKELQAIQDLAQGLAKAAAILGDVKAAMTIYTRESD